MKAVYPIVMSKGESHIVVYVPDFDINTQGENYADAMEMARDAIGLMGIDMEDDKAAIPSPSELDAIRQEPDYADKTITLVDVDFAEYRRKNDKIGRASCRERV